MINSTSEGFEGYRLHGYLEGVGGSLTELDSEESPLSITRVPRRSEKSEMVRLMLQKRTIQGVYSDVEKRRLLCGR